MSDVKLDKISEDISEIKVTLAAQHVTLVEHARRSTALEAQIEPLKAQSNEIKGAATFIKIMGTLATIVEVLHIFFT